MLLTETLTVKGRTNENTFERVNNNCKFFKSSL